MLKGIPKEYICRVRINHGDDRFIIALDKIRSQYVLFDISGDKAIKIAQNKSPTILENEYIGKSLSSPF